MRRVSSLISTVTHHVSKAKTILKNITKNLKTEKCNNMPKHLIIKGKEYLNIPIPESPIRNQNTDISGAQGNVGFYQHKDSIVAVKVYKNTKEGKRTLKKTMQLIMQDKINKNIACLPVAWIEVQGSSAMVFEAYSGDMFNLMESRFVTTKKASFNIYIQLAFMLAQLHSKNIVHCDFKPENVLVKVKSKSDIEVKLADLDSVMPIGSTTIPAYTPFYFPGDPVVTPKIDVYAFGKTLFVYITRSSAIDMDYLWKILSSKYKSSASQVRT